MTDLERRAQELRRQLLEDCFAGAASGLEAMLLDEDAVRQAGPEELEALARQHGLQ